MALCVLSFNCPLSCTHFLFNANVQINPAHTIYYLGSLSRALSNITNCSELISETELGK